MRSSNPAMTGRILEKTGTAAAGSSTMTINGTINKIGLMLLMVIAAGAYTWNMVMGADAERAGTLAIVGAIGGFIMALVTIFRPKSSAITAPIYAILEGLFLGAISALLNARYPGIAFQAVLLTIGTLFTMLFLYRSGRIRATPRFRRGVMMATSCIFRLPDELDPELTWHAHRFYAFFRPSWHPDQPGDNSDCRYESDSGLRFH